MYLKSLLFLIVAEGNLIVYPLLRKGEYETQYCVISKFYKIAVY